MKTKFMIADGIRCSLEELRKSVYTTIENQHELDLVKKTDCSINTFTSQKFFGKNLLPFRYSNGLVPQSN